MPDDPSTIDRAVRTPERIATSRLARTVPVVLVVAAAVAVSPAAAVQLGVTATDATAQPGTTVTVEFTVENSDDDTANASVLNVTSLPDGWSITDVDASDGGVYQPDTREVLWVNAPGGDSVTAAVTLSVPANASGGTYSVPATVSDVDGVVSDTAAANVTVDADSEYRVRATNATGAAGENVTVQYTVENPTSAEANGFVLAIDEPPANWSIVGYDGDGFANESSREVIYFRVPANGSATTNVTLSAPANATPGAYELGAELSDIEGPIDTVRATVVIVEPDEPLVERYDTNGNGKIDTGEVLAGIDDWSDGEIDTQSVLQLIAAWASQ